MQQILDEQSVSEVSHPADILEVEAREVSLELGDIENQKEPNVRSGVVIEKVLALPLQK